MKILVVCQYYYPEPFRISDICEELVNQGHEVTVITGVPNYPRGEIYPEYKRGQKRSEVVNGVKVQRCFTIGRNGGTIKRFLNYYSYVISSSIYTSHLQEEFDIVFVNQLSPVMMANAGIVYKKKHHKKMILYCLDLWPESLIAGGINRNSIIYKIFRRISAKIYSQSDRIIVTSRAFSVYFHDMFGICIDKISYLPQYAEDIFSPETCKKEPNGFIDLMFAGNIGLAQSVDTIIRAANETKDIKNLRWHIVGDGSELENCKILASNLDVTSVIFHGRKLVAEMPKYYAMADAMLVTMQADPVLSMTLPGKVQTYMAAGKPIVGSINGEASIIIKDAQCGYYAEAEDYFDLAQKCRIFANRKELYNKLGYNAFGFYQEHFSKKAFFDAITKQLFIS